MIGVFNLKIAFCINQLTKGGAERVVSNLSNYLVDNNDVTIISLRKDKPAYDISNKVIIKFLDKSERCNKIKKYYNRLNEMKRIIKKEKFDVIVSFLPEASFLSLLVKKDNKIIVSVRNDPKVEYKSFSYYLLMKLLYKKADGFIFQTRDAQKYFHEFNITSEIIMNSLNPNFLIGEADFSKEKKIVAVGRLTEQKNHKMLIRTFKKISERYKDYKLYIYGDGPLRKELENLIDELNLSELIILPGVIDNIKSEIINARMYVLCSNYEGMPNSLIEAFSLGIPCISTDCPCGGPREIIENGYNGYLITPEAEDELYNCMVNLIDNEDTCKMFSMNSIKSREKFNPQIVNKKWKEFIEKIVRS